MASRFLELALVLVWLLKLCDAIFTLNLNNVTLGGSVAVSWSGIDEKYFPLYIQGTAYNQTDSGVNAFKSNVTVGLTGNSFTWTSIPYPMRFMETSEYELELRPQNWDVQTQGKVPILGRSGMFEVKNSDDKKKNGGGATPTDRPTYSIIPQPGGQTNASNATTIVAICLGTIIPILIGAGVFAWWWRRRKIRELAEKRRRRRLFVIE